MRKTMKTAAVVAAMSAMTVASASMAFAATDDTRYSSTAKTAAAAGEAVGDWSGSNVNGWSFTPANGSKLKGTWANINNTWYYFEKDGIMAQNKLLYLEGETYYFDSEGRMMANGWVGFDDDSDVLYDYDLDVQENIDDIQNGVFKNDADAYEKVWLYFNADGTAKDDEWYQAESGLWYRFDDIIMVCGDFDHLVGDDYYGFDENGAMLVGWAVNRVDKNKTAPNKDEKTWYYYNSDGKKFVADEGSSNSYGWKKIDGNWYCFEAKGDSVGTLIVKAFFANNLTAGGNSDFYYVDKNGVMATGVVEVDKDAAFVSDAYDWAAGKKVKNVSEDGKSVEVYFGTDGKAKADTWNNNKFYAKVDATNVWEFDTDDAGSMAVSDYKVVNGNAAIKGALVKNSFIDKDDYYYVDKYGEKVVNSAIEVGNYVPGTDTFTASVKAASSTDERKAFVLANAKGVIYEDGDVDAERTVKVGSKKYVATGYEFNGMQVFYYDNNN